MPSLKELSPATVSRFKIEVLGRDFDLSVAYVSRAKMRALNATHRGIDRPTDILSYPYSKKSGELVLCLPEVRSHAKLHSKTPREYLHLLFIHGLVHLKGLDHGAIMDREEKKYWKQLHGITHRSRNRRWNLPGAHRRVSIR